MNKGRKKGAYQNPSYALQLSCSILRKNDNYWFRHHNHPIALNGNRAKETSAVEYKRHPTDFHSHSIGKTGRQRILCIIYASRIGIQMSKSVIAKIYVDDFTSCHFFLQIVWKNKRRKEQERWDWRKQKKKKREKTIKQRPIISIATECVSMRWKHNNEQQPRCSCVSFALVYVSTHTHTANRYC